VNYSVKAGVCAYDWIDLHIALPAQVTTMTQIMATIGPATSKDDMLDRMLELDVRLFRFPASKASLAELSVIAGKLKTKAKEVGIEIQCFLDLPGSKPRFTDMGGFEFDTSRLVSIAFGGIPDVSAELIVDGIVPANVTFDVGDIIIVGDGEHALEVRSIEPNRLHAVPLTSGVMGRRRGVTILGKANQYVSVTDVDRHNLQALPMSLFDGVIASFCEAAETIAAVRKALPSSETLVMAKIETMAGVASCREIARSADAILLGRGDLLLNTPIEDFYGCCRAVEEGCRCVQTPLVIGTQIMPSLSSSWLPNRSELAYACQLLESGVFGLMLSNETTMGLAPQRTIEVLAKLVQRFGAGQQDLLSRKAVFKC
jgi:pyruvate kinase